MGGVPNRRIRSSWNCYSYVENDPVNKNDPSGLFLPGDYDPFDSGGFQHNPLWWWFRNRPTFYGLGNPPAPSDFGGGGGAAAEPEPSRAEVAISTARHQSRSLLSVEECAEFIKSVLVNIGNQPDLDHFLEYIRQTDDLFSPGNDDKEHVPDFPHTAHVVPGTSTVHVVAPFASDLASTLLHEHFHTNVFGVGDIGLAKAVGNEVPLGTPDREEVASRNVSAAFDRHCDPSKLPK